MAVFSLGARRGELTLILAAISSARGRGARTCAQTGRHASQWAGGARARVHMGETPKAGPDVVVVGGGASGLFAAITAARGGARVLCLESGSQPLRKVRISGGGRCNVMHDPATWQPRAARELLAARYPRGAQELIGCFGRKEASSSFSPTDTLEWFLAEGVSLKLEEDGRVFPESDDSGTIIDCLLSAADRAGVQLQLGTKVESISADPAGAFEISFAQRGGEGARSLVRCAAVVLATGSASHALAQALGHEPSPLRPSLFAFRLAPGALLDASLAGVSLQDAELTLELEASPSPPEPQHESGAPEVVKKKKKGAPAARARGPLLVTHRGVSGPSALRLSAFGALPLAETGYKGNLLLNACPHLQPAEVAEELLDFTQGFHRLKQVGNISPFQGAIPRRLWRVLVANSASGELEAAGDGIDPTKKWEELGRAELRALEERLVRLRLPFSGKDSNKDETSSPAGPRGSSPGVPRPSAFLTLGAANRRRPRQDLPSERVDRRRV
ncbi:HI0933-like protein-domain-containing protein [Pavlovales sp. CCMP2436]|nr:HI0933-like protein-domain-containing protein [Pavlovales sp. CCMP2436]